jgi:hypothetical protein
MLISDPNSSLTTTSYKTQAQLEVSSFVSPFLFLLLATAEYRARR